MVLELGCSEGRKGRKRPHLKSGNKLETMRERSEIREKEEEYRELNGILHVELFTKNI